MRNAAVDWNCEDSDDTDNDYAYRDHKYTLKESRIDHKMYIIKKRAELCLLKQQKDKLRFYGLK